MASLPFPGRGEQFVCACCHDAGWLPDPFAAKAGDFIPCPCCHQDCRWTVCYDGDDGAAAADDLDPTGPVDPAEVPAPRPRSLNVRERRRRIARLLDEGGAA